ncbi:DNA-methyltransferase [Burkholderia cepacia]|uniref:Methyltransferase n=1 Tax=Burkholderia cepacia TaxID=292 RepID=A0A8I1AS45_BURCE|nr:DNA methyltransferase [Burkholderia cepacia]MBA9901710.1 site-specific DNA-methyltransferase [Burkholderia cepacia]MBA9948591.1 site-specific DNA-methyltransferase [Burkholderia cepacia]MBA9978919.1 site-specific DNA-methyltransferase [Burkholderia cepacia]MBA9997558.1 site-specific DNA-methyltransferase [Burkholderia cepacia]MBB0005569.1 site-specific DNA-methyltransferase [Burkholderia cepacia]
MRNAPGSVRDSIVEFLSTIDSASINEIHQAVETRLGDVSASSVRSYLNLNVPDIFQRVGRGSYRLAGVATDETSEDQAWNVTQHGRASLYHADCFEWLRAQPSNSIHAVVTDPPYGLVEYTSKEQDKLRSGRGGIWRIPPSFDGHQRSPLPRFTVLTDDDRAAMRIFFRDFARMLARVTVPGANIVVASNPLLAHLVADAMSEAGLEMRGYITRLVMTMRGGDRPKNAHEEFSEISVMPRSMHEPWVVLRKPLEGRVQDNLRKWGTGGFRRPSKDRPFGDVIRSSPTHALEKRIAPHPSLKPQDFLRQLVRGALPLGTGIVLDPFAGSGSTLAAANAVGYASVGVERDREYVDLAKQSIPLLEKIPDRSND